MSTGSAKRVRVKLIALCTGFWLIGFILGIVLMQASVKLEIGQHDRNTATRIVKIAEEFSAAALVEGDAEAARCLHALSRQSMLPGLARFAESELARLQTSAASGDAHLSASVIKALKELRATPGNRHEEPGVAP